MASPQGFSRFLDRHKIDTYTVDEDLTTAAVPDPVNSAVSGWYDMRDYDAVVFMATNANLTGIGVKSLSIVADSNADGGSGNNVTIVTHGVGTALAAEGDGYVIECSADQLRQEGLDAGTATDLRYVAISLGLTNAGDEAAVTVIRTEAKRKFVNLTPDTIVYA